MPEVILVDREDKEIGILDKQKAHELGLLHRAFSVFLFNKEGAMLLQKRSAAKYHSAGLWSNACCSHPLPGEDIAEAAGRRLQEELGIRPNIRKIFNFTYKVEFGNGLTEHEYDHVFMGEYSSEIFPDPEEVEALEWKTMKEIQEELDSDPSKFTAWFRIAFPGLRCFVEFADG
jgi:isopentenyl-diphosphate Delta-isomerase